MKKINVDRITRFGVLPLYHSKEWEDLKLDEDAIAEYRKYMAYEQRRRFEVVLVQQFNR